MFHLFSRKNNELGIRRLHLSSPGQSLIETMLAVAILTISIVGALMLLAQVSNTAVQARNRFIAANLTQEGIEFVQNIRMTNWIVMNSCTTNCPTWLTNLSPGTYCSDFTASPPALTSSGSACSLFLNASNMYVLTNTGSPTPFSRLITLTNGTDSDARTQYLDVQSRVTWDGGAHSVAAEERLYNWQ